MMKLPPKAIALMASGLVLAGTSGALGAVALTGSATQAPTKTTTVNIGTGATGPQGPAGPAGPQGPKGDPGTGGGVENCPVGSTFQAVVLNSPSGHVEIWTCVKT
jgi:hypothetical protein